MKHKFLLPDLVKMLRSKLFDLLPGFRGLQILKLGSGSGGVSEVYHAKFLSGIAPMRHLVHFSLTYDCTDEIIKQLQRNCRRTLKILDVEYSFRVTDASVNDMLKCDKLIQLHIFHTGKTYYDIVFTKKFTFHRFLVLAYAIFFISLQD